MRALILPDRDLLAREHALLRVLEVGLADEGYHVFHAVPASMRLTPEFAGSESPGVFSTPVVYADTGLPFTLAWRAAALIARLGEAVGEDASSGVSGPPRSAVPSAGPLVDVVHVLGAGAWALGVLVARRTGARLVVDVFESGAVADAARLAAAPGFAHGPVLLTADERLQRAAQRHVDGQGESGRRPHVHLAPWGVRVPDESHQWNGPGGRAWGGAAVIEHAPVPPAAASSIGQAPGATVAAESGAGLLVAHAPSVVLVGEGRDPAAIQSALEGLALVARVIPDLFVMVDAALARRAGVWKAAQRLDLLKCISVLAGIEARRSLALEADILFMPEADGRQRTVVLDAMARGMLVVARADPAVSWLRDGETARVVGVPAGASAPAPTAWSSALLGVWHDPGESARLARSARAFVRTSRLASSYVRGVLDAYAGREPATAARSLHGAGA